MQRKRLEEELGLRAIDHDRTAGGSHARRCESGEAPARDTDPRLPVRADGIEGATKDGMDATRHALDMPGVEVGTARLDRLDGETGLFEPPQDPLPLLLRRSGILLGEDQVGTVGERLREAHPRTHARLLGSGGACPQQRPAAGRRSERNGAAHELWPGAQSCAEGKRLDVQTGDHGNVCSTRTHVLLSTPKNSDSILSY